MAKELKVADLYSELRLDTKNYAAALTRSKKNLAEFQQDVMATNNKIKRTVTALTSSMEALGSSMEKLTGTKNLKTLNAEMTKTAKNIEKLQKKATQKIVKSGVKVAMKEAQLAAIQAEAAIRQVTKAAGKTSKLSLAGPEGNQSWISAPIEAQKAQKRNVQNQVKDMETIKTAAQSTTKEISKMQGAISTGTQAVQPKQVAEAVKVSQEMKRIVDPDIMRKRLAEMNAKTGYNAYGEEQRAADIRRRQESRELRGQAQGSQEQLLKAERQILTSKGKQLVEERRAIRGGTERKPAGKTTYGMPNWLQDSLEPGKRKPTALMTRPPTEVGPAKVLPRSNQQGTTLPLGLEGERMNRSWLGVSESMRGSMMSAQRLHAMQAKVQKQVDSMRQNWASIKNIVAGIMISQTFYTGLRVMKDWLRDTLEMSRQMEVAQASFTTMLGDAQQAKELLQYVQDFAAGSSFTFESAQDATKQLLAYGFELENIGYLMNVIGDASAAMGDTEAFGRIAKAFGQIQTKGKLATQEMLQLTEAGIPAFEILEEKLGLTKKQLGNIGHEGISSYTALTALSEGIAEKYGGAMAQIAQTTQGLKNNISETTQFIGVEAFKPMTDGWRNQLVKMSSLFTEWLAIVRTSGIGGLFEHVVPTELQDDIRLLIANTVQLAQSIGQLFSAFSPFTQALTEMGLLVANLVLPIITMINREIANFSMMLQSSSASVTLFRGAVAGLSILLAIGLMAKIASTGIATLRIAGAIVLPLLQATKASALFAAAMTTVKAVLAGPLGIPVAIAGITTLVGGLTLAGQAVSNLTANMGATVGAIGDDYLQPVYTEATDTTDMYQQSIRESTMATEDLGDATEKAGKKAKKAADGLLAFDEVFTLPPELDETDTPDAGGGGITLPDMGGPVVGMPIMPDMTQFAKDYTKNFDTAMATGFKPKRWWTAMWEDAKEGFAIGVERLGGVIGSIGAIFTTVYEVLRAGVRTVMKIFGAESASLQDIWGECGAKIKVSWTRVWSDLKGETSKGMSIIKKSTRNDMQGVIETFETALQLLPNITEENMGEAASIFTKQLRYLDEDALTVLRGTSDTMNMLFAGIRVDMSEDEANKIFVKNLKTMKDAGLLDINVLQKDIEKAMKKIKEGIITETDQAQKSANTLMGVMRDNSSQSAETMSKNILKSLGDMNKGTVETLKGMGGQWAQIFDGVTSDSDMESKETKKRVEDNIKKMKEDGTWNLNQLAIDSEKAFIKMAQDADRRTTELAKVVQGGTWDASVFAGVNAKLINENINQALETLPNQSKEHLSQAKQRMVDQLVEAGHLTRAEGDQIVRGLMGELNKTPGQANTVFGIDLKNAINKAVPTVLDAVLSYGKETAAKMISGAVDGLKAFPGKMLESFKSGWGTFTANAGNTVKTWNPLSVWSMTWKMISDFADSLWAGFKSGWNSFTSWVGNTVSSWNPFSGKKFKIDFPKPGDPDFIGPVKSNSRGMAVPQSAYGGISTKTNLRTIASASRTNSNSSYNQEELAVLGNMISGSVSSALAGGMQMQTQMLKGVTQTQSNRSSQQTNMVVFAMDDNNVRTLLRRLRIEAEREQARTFNSLQTIL